MAKSKKNTKMRPALTPEAREDQLIALAMDRVEERICNGEATSQELVHFLKLGSSKYRREIEKLEEENKLLRAKTETLNSARRDEEFYAKVLRAINRYNGNMGDDVYDDQDVYGIDDNVDF